MTSNIALYERLGYAETDDVLSRDVLADPRALDVFVAQAAHSRGRKP